jgi:spoIIIJ-associated protein
MEWLDFTAKSVDEALTEALIQLKTTSDNVEYEVIEKESSGFLGLFNKPAKIRVRLKATADSMAKEFLNKVFRAMNIVANIDTVFDEDNSTLDINLEGEEMGVLIGKRGQTLDSLQYLVSLVVNKDSENYLKIKLDTEDYRHRRKETLENLARNIAFKVKRTKKPVSLEPMNPYERRIIHSALQNDKYVETHSEGEEPYRKVVVTLKKGFVNKDYKHSKSKYSYGDRYQNSQKNREYNHSSQRNREFNHEKSEEE